MINYYELVINNPAYFKQFSCKELLFLNYDCPVNVKKAATWSEHNYIYYVLSGKKTLHTIDQSFTLTKGSIAFVKKGACIVEQFFDEPFCIIALIMPDTFIHSFLKDYVPVQKNSLAATPPVIPVYNDVIIEGFYQSILPYFVSAATVPEEILELKFRELLLHMLHNPDNEELRSHLLSIKQAPLAPLKEMLDTNFAYNLNIEAYARISNRSISSFKRDFRAIYNTSPGRWLLEKKLTHAKELLIQANDPVSDVAFRSGFENTAHFSRVFKQKTGVTPLEYRKKASANRLTPA